MAALLHDGSLKGGKAQKVMNFLNEMGIGSISYSHDMPREERSESEITRLKESIKKLEAEKETGLVQFYKLLKKASDLESHVLRAEKKVLEAEEHAKSVSDIVHEWFNLEIEKNVLIDFIEGIAYEAEQLLLKNFVLENEKESLILQVKEFRESIEDSKLELSQTMEDNEALVLEKSVLVLLFKELKIESEEADEDRKALVQNLNLEFSILQESHHNLQTQMAKVIEENTVLKKEFMELKQQNHALYEDLIHQSEQNVATSENSIEILNCRKDFLTRDAQIHPESTDIQLLKDTKLDRIITVEKTVDYMKRITTADDEDTKIKHNVPKTLAEEFRFQCSYTVDDHQRICKIQHSNPKCGLKKSSSGNSDTKLDDDFNGKEKKHKNRISDFGKKFLPKKYLSKTRDVMH